MKHLRNTSLAHDVLHLRSYNARRVNASNGEHCMIKLHLLLHLSRALCSADAPSGEGFWDHAFLHCSMRSRSLKAFSGKARAAGSICFRAIMTIGEIQ